MSLRATHYAEITARLAEILSTDPRLSEGLREPVQVMLGPPRITALNLPATIFVYRARIDDPAYASGIAGVDQVLQWELALVTQRVGDPEELEQQASVLVCNVHRILYDYRADAPLWTVLKVGGSRAGELRGEADQSWDVERVAVEIRLYGVDL